MNTQGAILTDGAILAAKKNRTIVIKPFKRKALGTNSYDCHLGDTLAVYEGYDKLTMRLIKNEITYEQYLHQGGKTTFTSPILDAKEHNKIITFKIPKKGLILYNFIFYLGVTKEYTETHAHVPFIEGKSSTGRLGMDIHATAGKGDVGFCGYWTLEISVKEHLRIYANMPIGQLIYFSVEGKILTPYNKKPNAKYSGQGGKPVESMMFKNFEIVKRE